MGITGINAKARRRYTLKEDTADNPTVFVFILPSLDMQQNMFSQVGTNNNLSLKLIDDLLISCLVEVDNLKFDSGDGLIVALDWKKDREQVLSSLTIAQRSEIAGHILMVMSGNQEFEKN